MFAYIHLGFLIYFEILELNPSWMFHLSYAMIGKEFTKENQMMIFRK